MVDVDKVTATVRVRSDDEANQRPTRVRMEEAADYLRKLGFDVLRVGRFGLSVQAFRSVLERELGVQLGPDDVLVSEVNPPKAELAKLIDLVEIAPPAEHFAPSAANDR